MLGIPVALFFANGVEWYTHKYALHGTPQEGGGRKSPDQARMKNHWAHHRRARLAQYRDDELYQHPMENDAGRLEIKGVLLLAGLTTLALPVAPLFTLTSYYCGWNYYTKHRKSHLDPEWGKKNIPWHYDHHMNTNQDANWCVTKPWFDYIMGTRVISSADLQESNPLGIKLPQSIENKLNAWVRRYAPQTFAKLDANMQTEQVKRENGLENMMPTFAESVVV
ncbi:MAG: hypothetical protein NVSMB40_09150 [Aquirhabdus sp.]